MLLPLYHRWKFSDALKFGHFSVLKDWKIYFSPLSVKNLKNIFGHFLVSKIWKKFWVNFQCSKFEQNFCHFLVLKVWGEFSPHGFENPPTKSFPPTRAILFRGDWGVVPPMIFFRRRRKNLGFFFGVEVEQICHKKVTKVFTKNFTCPPVKISHCFGTPPPPQS